MTDDRPALPAPAVRALFQRRSIELDGYLREDGFWDIDGLLRDTRPFEYLDYRNQSRPAHAPVHEMAARLTVDDERTVVDAHAFFMTWPFASCLGAAAAVKELVGCQIGPGWRETMRTKLPPHTACTHLSELLVAMATVAYQTQAFGKSPHGTNPMLQIRQRGTKPFFLGKCRSWREDGALTKEVFSDWYRDTPKE